jgi:Ca-activated chloride channel homolog
MTMTSFTHPGSQLSPYRTLAAKSWHPPAPKVPASRFADSLRRKLAMTAVLVLCVFLQAPGTAYADEIAEQQSGNLLLRMQAGYQVATRINTDVDMQISGMVARITVSQVFRNDGDEWVEGIYVFPLPEGAAVDRLRMRAGERVIEGEIREKAAAKKAYETAKKEGKRASLVGQQRSNLFTTNVANIAPAETVTIEISYLETVKFDDGTFSLRFPMTLTPRYIPGLPTGGRQGSGWAADTNRVPDASLVTPPMVARSNAHRISLQADIDAGLPLEIIASRYHPINVADGKDRYTVTLSSKNEVTDHDFELVWRPKKSAVPKALLFAEDVDDRRHLLLMLMPPAITPAADELPSRDLTFVIDTSGSMHGTSMEQAKQAVLMALGELRPADWFNVIQFNSVTESLFSQSVPATPENVRTAMPWVQGLNANGGTEMRPALLAALSAGNEHSLRQVVFVTDGAVGNETELFELIEQRLGDTRLFTIGIGSAPNGWFMQKAAEVGRGTFVYISALHEVKEKMNRLLKRLREPMLTDIELQWPDGVQADMYPARVADLYSGEPVIVKARLQLPPRPGDQLLIRGNAPSGTWSAEVPLASSQDNAGVAALWARERIAGFTDDERRGADAEEIRQAIVDIALAYGLVSKHTSLVAVDKTPVRPADANLNKEQVPNLLPYGQSQQAIFGFPATATVAPIMRFSGALLLLLASLMCLYRICTMKVPGRDTLDADD